MQALREAFLNFIKAAQTKSQTLRQQAIQDTLGKSMSEVTLPWVVEELESQQDLSHKRADCVTELHFVTCSHKNMTKISA